MNLGLREELIRWAVIDLPVNGTTENTAVDTALTQCDPPDFVRLIGPHREPNADLKDSLFTWA
jgi:hypothetical protein